LKRDRPDLIRSPHNQRDRRNLSDAEMLSCHAMLDSRKQRHIVRDDGGKFTPKAQDCAPGKEEKRQKKLKEM